MLVEEHHKCLAPKAQTFDCTSFSLEDAFAKQKKVNSEDSFCICWRLGTLVWLVNCSLLQSLGAMAKH